MLGSRIVRLAGTALAAALAVPLALAGPAAAAPVDLPRPGIPARYLTQQIHWTPCSFDARVKRLAPAAPTTTCASIRVPMDWHHPGAHPDITVAIAYSKATGHSSGLMMSSPGGPGSSGLSLTAGLAAERPRLFTDFDLVGFDPRGFGRSTPLRCTTTNQRLAALPTTPDYRQRTAQTHRSELAQARLLAEACAATELAPFVSTQQTVYDMELIRALLRSRILHFLGYSYGAWLGAWYADTYPDRVGRFVLDSAMDLTRSQWQNASLDPYAAQRRFDTQLVPWLARHADQIRGLGATPGQVRARYAATRAALVRLVRAGRSNVRGDDLDAQVHTALSDNAGFVRAALDLLVHEEFVRHPSASGDVAAAHLQRAWARIAPELRAHDSLAALQARYAVTPPAPVDALPAARRQLADARRQALAAPRPQEVVDLGAVGTTVRCNDSRWRHDVASYLRAAAQNARRYPFYGYLNGVPMCAYWPYPPQERTLDLAGSPRVLLIQAELDPATAYEGAQRTRRALGNRARLVSIDDEGQHSHYIGSPSACVERIGDQFVFTGELPGRDEVCATRPLPGDGAVYPVTGPVDARAR